MHTLENCEFFIGWLEVCFISAWPQNIQNANQKCEIMVKFFLEYPTSCREFAWSIYKEKVTFFFCCFFDPNSNHLKWRQRIKKTRKWRLVVTILRENVRDVARLNFLNQLTKIIDQVGFLTRLLKKVLKYTKCTRVGYDLIENIGGKHALQVIHSRPSEENYCIRDTRSVGREDAAPKP